MFAFLVTMDRVERHFTCASTKHLLEHLATVLELDSLNTITTIEIVKLGPVENVQ